MLARSPSMLAIELSPNAPASTEPTTTCRPASATARTGSPPTPESPDRWPGSSPAATAYTQTTSCSADRSVISAANSADRRRNSAGTVAADVVAGPVVHDLRAAFLRTAELLRAIRVCDIHPLHECVAPDSGATGPRWPTAPPGRGESRIPRARTATRGGPDRWAAGTEPSSAAATEYASAPLSAAGSGPATPRERAAW